MISPLLERTKIILELVTNSVVLCVALGAAFYLVRSIQEQPRRAMSAEARPTTLSHTRTSLDGEHVSLTGLGLKRSSKTLVVAISTKCHFCVSSASFYSTLTAQRHNIPIVMVLPQPEPEAREFLTAHRIFPEQFVNTELSNVDVQGTPTILLIDKDGKILKSWVGELQPDGQAEVVKASKTL